MLSQLTSARTVVDFPVPRSPMTMIPPMLGSMMFMIAANFISSCPMMALKGYTGLAAASAASSVAAVGKRALEGRVERGEGEEGRVRERSNHFEWG